MANSILIYGSRPNTKLFMGKTSKQRCIPPRIRGMKQTYTSQPPSCEAINI